MRRDARGANAPLEKREGDDEHHEQPMLRDFGIFQALDEAALTDRPDLWIRAKEQQRGKQQKEQWPMLRPRRMSAALREGGQSHQHQQQAGPMMVVLGPRKIVGISR